VWSLLHLQTPRGLFFKPQGTLFVPQLGIFPTWRSLKPAAAVLIINIYAAVAVFNKIGGKKFMREFSTFSAP
jgi:hypothetical protein